MTVLFLKQHLHIAQTPSGQAYVLIVIFGAGDNAGRQGHGEPEILLLVELGILECGQPFDLVDQG